MYNKFYIYYQPKENRGGVRSLGITFYDFDVANDKYKKKIVLEKEGNKYKIKEQLSGVEELWNKLNGTKLPAKIGNKANMSEDYYYVQCDNISVETNNKADIQEILDIVRFDDVVAYEIDNYQMVP